MVTIANSVLSRAHHLGTQRVLALAVLPAVSMRALNGRTWQSVPGGGA
jgi:hypothetical protein